MSQNKLTVQLNSSTDTQFERMLIIEGTLIEAFSQNNFAIVDGHDVGQGRFNLSSIQQILGAPC